MLVLLIQFLIMLLSLLIWIVVAQAILSWLVAFNVINTHNEFVRNLFVTLNRLIDPMLRPIRKVVPDLGGIDLSPAVLILGLIFLRDVIMRGLLVSLFF